MTSTKVAILIDGGYVRHVARKAGLDPSPDFVEDLAHSLVEKGEALYRVFYYDCRPYNGRQRKPVSGEEVEYNLHPGWLDDIAGRDYFAMRLGQLKFRGWQLRDTQGTNAAAGGLNDDDFQPVFEQRGIDVRFGLDVANLVERGRVDRVIIVTGDVDLIPAFKAARLGGLQVVGIELPGWQLHEHILVHSDEVRQVGWPQPSAD